MKKSSDLRSIFKAAAKERTTLPTGTSLGSKYSGKSKDELLALLKAKKSAKLTSNTFLGQCISSPQSEIIGLNSDKPSVTEKVLKPSDENVIGLVSLYESGESDSEHNVAVSTLPAGFFDENIAQNEESDSVSGVPVNDELLPSVNMKFEYEQKHDYHVHNIEDTNPQNTSEDSVQVNGHLPKGFFDDEEVDAKARGLDLAKEKQHKEDMEWREFSKFISEVKQTEEEVEIEENSEVLSRLQRDEIEQLTYMGRLAGLMQESEKAQRKRKRPNNMPFSTELDDAIGVSDIALNQSKSGIKSDDADKAAEDLVQLREISVAKAPEDSAAIEISKMLKAKKKRRKEEYREAFRDDYVPLDPSDWRAKMF